MNKIVAKRVITLAGSPRGEKFFLQEVAKEFRPFLATDGRKREGYDLFNVDGYKNLHDGASPLPGEVGCAISHYRLLEEFATAAGDPEDFLLVAEDDARFLPEFQQILTNILKQKDLADVVVLSSAQGEGGIRNIASNSEWNFQHSLFAKKVGSSWHGDAYKIGSYSGILWGAGLYMIRRKATRSYVDFVKRCGGVHWRADDWDYFKDPAGVQIRVVRPPMTNFEGETEVQASDKQEKLHDREKTLSETIALRTRIYQFTGRVSATLQDIANMTEYRPR